jgi:hypothetical protein
MGVFAGLCTIFTLLATISDAWQEHTQQGWPVATATIQRCEPRPLEKKTRHLLARRLPHQLFRVRRRNCHENPLSGSTSISDLHVMNVWNHAAPPW